MLRLNEKYWYLITHTVFATTFGKIGKRTLLFKPMQIDGRRSIHIDDDVYIAQFSWLMGNNKKKKTLTIKSGTTIGHYAHIVALHSVTIEKSVLIADKVFISDCTHKFEDVTYPVIKQGVEQLSTVGIGEGSWLGENVCILGASVGKHCVIGANSVVTSDIPNYCVAVGTPAKVVKKYDFEKNAWVRI